MSTTGMIIGIVVLFYPTYLVYGISQGTKAARQYLTAHATAKNILIALMVTFSFVVGGFKTYSIGRDRGFNQGWDKGYIRGLENPQNAVDSDEVCINHQCESEQE